MTVQTDNPYLDAALAAYEAGLSVLPPKEDGSKEPIPGGWARFQRRRASLGMVQSWYENGRTGVGAVMGDVSGYVNLFEFDDGATYLAFMEAATAAGLRPLIERIRNGYSERTPGNGIHWLIRCETFGKSRKLARRLKREDEQKHLGDKYKVLIETKGTGGYAILAPSGGNVHPSKGSYERLAGGFDTIAEITADEWESLQQLARSFDESGVDEDERPVRLPHPANATADRPGDDFVARTGWAQILEPHGWQEVYRRNEVTYWRRPGKNVGISATTNFGGSDLLYVFTTSTAFDSERGYNRFSAYAMLNHGGDFAAAARALVQEGFGKPRASSTVVDYTLPDADAFVSIAVDESTGEVIETKRRFEIIDGPDFLGRPPQRWLVHQVIPEQSFFCILGQPGSYKSFVALDLALAIATGTPFQGHPARQGSVLYVCAEGAGGFAARMRAWQKGRGIAIPRCFKVLPGVVPLTSPDVVKEFIAQVRDQFPDDEFSMVIFDTLSRSMPGGDENSPVDMTTAVACATLVQDTLNVCAGIIHHGTKADGTFRGHSSGPAALDTIIRVAADSGVVSVRSEKQKDGEPFAMMTLKPTVVDLELPASFTAEDDDDLMLVASRTSVVLEPLNEQERQQYEDERRRIRLTDRQWLAAERLYQVYGPGGATHIEWWEATNWPTAERSTFRKIRDALVAKSLVREEMQGVEARYFVSGLLARALLSRAEASVKSKE